MSLNVLDGLVAWRRSLAASNGPLEGLSFAHYLEDNPKKGARPFCLITEIKQEGDTESPVCVRFTVIETLTCDTPLVAAAHSVYKETERLRTALSGANLDGLAKTNWFTLHTHVLRGWPTKRTKDGTVVTLRWTVIASWRP